MSVTSRRGRAKWGSLHGEHDHLRGRLLARCPALEKRDPGRHLAEHFTDVLALYSVGFDG